MHSLLLPSTTARMGMGMGSRRAAAISSSHRACVQSAFARTESIPGGPLASPQLASTSYSQDRQLAEACIATLTAALEPDASTRFWCHQVNSGLWALVSRDFGATEGFGEVYIPWSISPNVALTSTLYRYLTSQGWGAGRRFYEASIGLALQQHPEARRLIRCKGEGGRGCSYSGGGAGQRFHEASIGLALRQQPEEADQVHGGTVHSGRWTS